MTYYQKLLLHRTEYFITYRVPVLHWMGNGTVPVSNCKQSSLVRYVEMRCVKSGLSNPAHYVESRSGSNPGFGGQKICYKNHNWKKTFWVKKPAINSFLFFRERLLNSREASKPPQRTALSRYRYFFCFNFY
jgi:hypothetical protein